MKKKIGKNKNLLIYQAKNGAIELRGDFSRETIWATQAQIASIFDVTPQNVTIHLRNIFKDDELEEKATCKDSLQVQKEGGREIERTVKLYNLDVIIAVGYRINSLVGTKFRQWATKTLRSYVVDGFVINKTRIAKNYSHFLSVVDSLKGLLPVDTDIKAGDAVELVSLFADTWLSLDAYDREELPKGKLTKKKVALTIEKISVSLAGFRKGLIDKSSAMEMFGVERNSGAVASIIGNVMQTFGGRELYASVEEKAAHLLYFMVKNHPFTDGNKRNGAFAFVWYLRQANILDVSKITPSALTALTILVASSDPKEKDKVVALILNLITRK
ncbi:MAG: virulence protein RhuM/Fic/DOC family protein [bacterium]|nr:virulence protein RhuM/Fic/DOC family protein [bacterium]